ncbi:MAG: acylphosphatase [Betaproteobacteria bacterium]|nr:MAG: acylphosphatase [Betaproteobacteria bacterium]
MIARRIVIRGQVQGVGFRFALVDAARESGVAGWVRNRFDGTVEALVQGESRATERMIEWCRRGPPGARVIDVDVTDVPVDPLLTDFAQRPTL